MVEQPQMCTPLPLLLLLLLLCPLPHPSSPTMGLLAAGATVTPAGEWQRRGGAQSTPRWLQLNDTFPIPPVAAHKSRGTVVSESIALFDCNRDGRTDFLVLNYGVLNLYIREEGDTVAYRHVMHSETEFVSSSGNAANRFFYRSVVADDVNGDAIDDIVVNYSALHVVIFTGDGECHFEEDAGELPSNQESVSLFRWDVATSRDGFPDLFTGSASQDYLYENHAPALSTPLEFTRRTWADYPGAVEALNQNPEGHVLFDFNHDSVPDIVAMPGPALAYSGPPPYRPFVLQSVVDAETFAVHYVQTSAAVPFPEDGRETEYLDIAFGDCNNDGQEEMAYVVRTDPSRTFDVTESVIVSLAGNDTHPYTHFAFPLPALCALETCNLSNVRWGDVDLDGNLDLFYTVQLGQSYVHPLIYLNPRGDCTFERDESLQSWELQLPEQRLSIAALADLDHDGYLDIVFPPYAFLNSRVAATVPLLSALSVQVEYPSPRTGLGLSLFPGSLSAPRRSDITAYREIHSSQFHHSTSTREVQFTIAPDARSHLLVQDLAWGKQMMVGCFSHDLLVVHPPPSRTGLSPIVHVSPCLLQLRPRARQQLRVGEPFWDLFADVDQRTHLQAPHSYHFTCPGDADPTGPVTDLRLSACRTMGAANVTVRFEELPYLPFVLTDGDREWPIVEVVVPFTVVAGAFSCTHATCTVDGPVTADVVFHSDAVVVTTDGSQAFSRNVTLIDAALQLPPRTTVHGTLSLHNATLALRANSTLAIGGCLAVAAARPSTAHFTVSQADVESGTDGVIRSTLTYASSCPQPALTVTVAYQLEDGCYETSEEITHTSGSLSVVFSVSPCGSGESASVFVQHQLYFVIGAVVVAALLLVGVTLAIPAVRYRIFHFRKQQAFELTQS